jgi:hypothetical protein
MRAIRRGRRISSPLDPLWNFIGDKLVAFLLIVAATSIGGVVFKLRKPSIRRWPLADGTLEFGESGTEQAVVLDIWFCELSYSYSVNGEFFSGQSRVRVQNEEAADALIRDFKGKRVRIRYSPENPAKSVLLWEDQAALHGSLLRP